MTGVATVYLVDDDAAVRTALARLLRSEGFVVMPFASAEAFLAEPRATVDACLVLDVTMPGLDGLALQRHLAAAGAALPIVFVTGNGDIPRSVQAIKAGAVDFLTKPVRGAALVDAIRGGLHDFAAMHARDSAHAALRGRLDALTPRERQTLQQILSGKLNKQIAADLGIAEQTVKFHRARIMEKMQARTAAELMHMAARLGLEDGGDAPPPAPGTWPKE